MLLSFFIGLMTVVLVLDCLLLLLLILIQLPKKEAGLGQAFGSGTTDALFGAGSGTALTKMTKYAAGVFFVVTFLLTILNTQKSKSEHGGRLGQIIEKAGKTAPAPPVTPMVATNPPLNITPALTNLAPAFSNPPTASPAPAKPATSAAAANSTPASGTNKPAAAQPK